MNDKIITDFKKRLNLKKDSKLSVYFNENGNFVTEIHNLSNISVSFFILVMLDNLIKENIIKKDTILDMINEIL